MASRFFRSQLAFRFTTGSESLNFNKRTVASPGDEILGPGSFRGLNNFTIRPLSSGAVKSVPSKYCTACTRRPKSSIEESPPCFLADCMIYVRTSGGSTCRKAAIRAAESGTNCYLRSNLLGGRSLGQPRRRQFLLLFIGQGRVRSFECYFIETGTSAPGTVLG